MLTGPDRLAAVLSPFARLRLLRFAASFVWADLAIAESERRFMLELATELDIDHDDALALLALPPAGDDVDPTTIHPRLADAVRRVALRAIAADGHVEPKEMQMFDLLDALLPASAAHRNRDGRGDT